MLYFPIIQQMIIQYILFLNDAKWNDNTHYVKNLITTSLNC